MQEIAYVSRGTFTDTFTGTVTATRDARGLADLRAVANQQSH
jgi:hypothetical protein